MSKYADIIERLEKATGPDIELGAAILTASGTYVLERRGSDRQEWLYPTFQNYGRINPKFCGEYGKDPTRYIDTAIALVERMFSPGYYRLEKLKGLPDPHHAYWATAGASGEQEDAYAPTSPLAILLALFRALEAKEGP